MSINTSTRFIQKATGITSVFYQGTEEEWGQIVTEKDFINLNSVTVLFNYFSED